MMTEKTYLGWRYSWAYSHDDDGWYAVVWDAAGRMVHHTGFHPTAGVAAMHARGWIGAGATVAV